MAGTASRRQVTDAPPGRYRVVERGRRLVVIDTRTGQPATRAVKPTSPPRTPMPASAPIETTQPRTIDDRSGAAILRTMPLYDLKGPREIVLSQGFTDRLSRAVGGWMIAFFVFAVVATLLFPWLWLLPILAAFQPKVHAAFRNWMTARLDEADQAAS